VHEIPATGSAQVHVLHDGYVGLDGDDGRVSGTVTLIVDSPAVIVVDPGMVASRSGLLAALGSYGFEPSGVTDVVRRAGGRNRATASAGVEQHLCFDGRVPAGVEDLAPDHVLNGAHDISPWRLPWWDAGFQG
jgi:hypothetical protein